MNNILHDSKSRYNNLDNTNIIFLTPNQVFDLDIGFNKTMFKEDEYNDLFPFLVETLKEMIKETTLGDINGSEIELPVENSESRVFICIEINGKLCKLQSEEWDITNNFRGLPLNVQVKVFQRLISEEQITLDDLAAEDIDTSVYKKLCINDISGVQICRDKVTKIDKIVEEQSHDKTMIKRKERVIASL